MMTKKNLERFPSSVDKIIRKIIRETRILDERLFQIGDFPPEMVTSEVTQYPNQITSDPLVSSLAWALYLKDYAEALDTKAIYDRGQDMLPELRAANTCLEGWDSGWKIEGVDEKGGYSLHRNDQHRAAFASDLKPLATDEKYVVGDMVSLRRIKEDAESQPGFYYCIGDTYGDSYDDRVSVRIYLNIQPSYAAAWVNAITLYLNRYRIPFQFKILRYSGSYRRIDRAVLYIPRRYAAFTARLVLGIKNQVGGLGNRHPFLTKKVAPGIGIADNPPGGESLGLHRMNLIAKGIVYSWRRKDRNLDLIYRSVVLSFKEAGINLKCPWLNPGNAPFIFSQENFILSPHKLGGESKWLEVADRIGSILVRDAIWYENRCTWMGWGFVDNPGPVKGRIVTYGGDFYEGVSGIALFLAQLSVLTNNNTHRSTAFAALRYAIGCMREKQVKGVGAYSGLAGVLFSCVEMYRVTKEREILPYIRELIRNIETSQLEDCDTDIISGRSGAIRALLYAGTCVPSLRTRVLNISCQFGHDLIRLASRNGRQWSWKTLEGEVHKNLLGYSHGAAGVGGALLDLYQETGEAAFKNAAYHALEYEISNFDRPQKNWPDWRSVRGQNIEQKDFSCLCAWCHGAPGEILSLLKFQEYKPSPDIENIIAQALDTVVSGTIVNDNGNFCLCHGVAGNADVLMQVSGQNNCKELKDLVDRLAQEGVDRYHDAGNWPCRIPGAGQSLGLMTGLAGIGYFYLRQHDKTMPSPLSF